MKTIVITGGPCAGKTSALPCVRERLERAGFSVVVVPEAATDLILDGIAPWTCASVLDFQTRVIALQSKREAEAVRLVRQAEETGLLERVGRATCKEDGPIVREFVIVCDRGVCDSRTYLTEEEFSQALAANGLDMARALARYDAVFHLESVAKSDAGAYTRQNNSARFEDAAEAADADERGIRAWAAHPSLSIIGTYSTFEEKADALCEAIGEALGVPQLALHGDTPILVSACLLGTACRYDGASVPCSEVKALADSLELVPVCPEQLGGLPTPRTPSEIQTDGRVIDREGADRTAAFSAGACEALRIARERGCMQAILKSRSPSCGVRQVYDGSFSGTVVPGRGVTASMLADAGIELFDENDFMSD